jgi:serine protease inhibitor
MAINAWAADQTAGKIVNLVPPSDITSGTAMALVDALHVKVPWANPLSRAHRRPHRGVSFPP